MVHVYLSRHFILILALFQTPVAFGQNENYVIGVIAGITGAGSSYGNSIVQGAKMAVAEVNTAGGIKGRYLKLKIVDDSSEPARSAIAMRRLVSSSPDVIVGGWGSSQVLAHLDFAEQSAIPYIVVGATNSKIISKHNQWVFRVIPSDDIIVSELAKHTNKNKYKKIAIIHDRNAYGSGSRDLYIKALRQYDLKPAIVQSYQTFDKNFQIQLTEIKKQKPDAIVFFGTVPAIPIIMKQARKLGISAQFLGTGGLANEALLTTAKNAAEGTKLISFYHEDMDDKVSDWSKRYTLAYGETKHLNPANAIWEYSAIKQIVAPCLTSVGNNRIDLRNCIANWRGNFTGIKKQTQFNQTGQLNASPIAIQVQNASFQLLHKRD